MNVITIHVTKTEMLQYHREPYFGYTLVSGQSAIIWIRKDLPKAVYLSVLAHERCHALDADFSSLFKREARAWWAALKETPLGFFYSILLSLSPARLHLYWRRLLHNF